LNQNYLSSMLLHLNHVSHLVIIGFVGKVKSGDISRNLITQIGVFKNTFLTVVINLSTVEYSFHIHSQILRIPYAKNMLDELNVGIT